MESSASVDLVTTLAAVVGGVIVLVTIVLSLWSRKRAETDRARRSRHDGGAGDSSGGSDGDGAGGD